MNRKTGNATGFNFNGLKEVRAAVVLCAMEDLENAYKALPKAYNKWRSRKANLGKMKRRNERREEDAEKRLKKTEDKWRPEVSRLCRRAMNAKSPERKEEYRKEYLETKAKATAEILSMKKALEETRAMNRDKAWWKAKSGLQSSTLKLNVLKETIKDCEGFFESGELLLFTEISGDLILGKVREKVDYGKVAKAKEWVKRI